MLITSFHGAAGITFANYRELLKPVYRTVLFNTIKVSLEVMLTTVILGYATAYWMTRMPPRRVPMIMLAVSIPFWISLLVRTYTWIVLLRHEGVVNKLASAVGLGPFNFLYNAFAVHVGIVQFLLPYMVFSAYAVMRGIDLNLIRAAQSLGAPPHRVFRHVFLPLSVPGVAAGSLIVFILSLGFFVTPAVLGGPAQTMVAQIIWQQVEETLNWGFASAISVVLLTFIALLMVVFDRWLGLDKIWRRMI
jgi:ABC-type spermidine/putrescine transport system permease subunit I